MQATSVHVATPPVQSKAVKHNTTQPARETPCAGQQQSSSNRTETAAAHTKFLFSLPPASKDIVKAHE
jgi:hypothetical protein